MARVKERSKIKSLNGYERKRKGLGNQFHIDLNEIKRAFFLVFSCSDSVRPERADSSFLSRFVRPGFDSRLLAARQLGYPIKQLELKEMQRKFGLASKQPKSPRVQPLSSNF